MLFSLNALNLVWFTLESIHWNSSKQLLFAYLFLDRSHYILTTNIFTKSGRYKTEHRLFLPSSFSFAKWLHGEHNKDSNGNLKSEHFSRGPWLDSMGGTFPGRLVGQEVLKLPKSDCQLGKCRFKAVNCHYNDHFYTVIPRSHQAVWGSMMRTRLLL